MARPRKKKQENKITFQTIAQENEKYNELITITFDDGRYTEVYKYFSPERIDALHKDFAKFVSDYEKFDPENFYENKTIDYINLHTLIHFSTVLETIPDNFEEKLSIFTELQKSELAEKIFESFDMSEVRKIYDRMWKKFKAVEEMVKANDEMREKLIEQVKDSELPNKDVILSAFFGEGETNGHNEPETT